MASCQGPPRSAKALSAACALKSRPSFFGLVSDELLSSRLMCCSRDGPPGASLVQRLFGLEVQVSWDLTSQCSFF